MNDRIVKTVYESIDDIYDSQIFNLFTLFRQWCDIDKSEIIFLAQLGIKYYNLYQIQRSSDCLNGKQTMIIIAHRLSTIRNCNYIYVFDKGRIVQEGTWNNLISDSNSYFTKMCQLQGINN